ncbi:MAG: YkgJ family cysteine cluster protein [Desulfuromonadaceae bacterium]
MYGDNSDWDSRCKQCGSCCFEKIEDERGNIFYMQSACRFLDVVTRRCKIFERRFEINPSCIQLTPELVPTLRWLPRDCGYHRKVAAPVKASRKSKP